MSRKIIGVTVGTPISSTRLDREIKPVKTVNGVAPDESGNVKVKTDGANALKGNASGEVVRLDDVSPLEHEMKVKVRSRNILNIDAMLNANLTKDGDTYTLAAGTYSNKVLCDIPSATSAVFSAEMLGGSLELLFYHQTSEGAMSNKCVIDADNVSSTAQNGFRCYCVRLFASEDVTFKNPQLEIGTTKTDYIPYTAKALNICGKNLFSFDGNTENLDVITQPNQNRNVAYTVKVPQPGNYTVWAKRISGTRSAYIGASNDLTNQDKNILYVSKYTFESLSADDVLYIINNFGFSENPSASGSKEKTIELFNSFEIQIELGKEKTDFEPYVEPAKYTVNADGTVMGVKSFPVSTMIFSTDTPGMIIDVEYNRDINKAFAALETAIISQ